MNTLHEQLMQNTKEQLKDFAAFYSVKSAYKYNKIDLCNHIIEAMQEQLPVKLAYIEPNQIKEFEELAKGQLGNYLENVDLYWTLKGLGFIVMQGESSYQLGEEIQRAYQGICNDLSVRREIKERQTYFHKLSQYRTAALNLYGIIPVSEFVELINGFGEEINEVLFIEWINDSTFVEPHFYIEDELLIHDSFAYVAPEEMEYFLSDIKLKPRYIPSKEVFLKYADEDYYERNATVLALETYLNKKYPGDTEVVEDLIYEIIMDRQIELIPNGQVMKEILGMFEYFGFEVDSMEEVNQIVNLCAKLINTTRIWVNKGYTPDELHHLRGNVMQQKVGRNDACPCGSGKKYKKCCGK